MKMIKQIKLPSELFDKILDDTWNRYESNVKLHYSCGYRGKNDKSVVVYDEEYLVCELAQIYTSLGAEVFNDDISTYDLWKQVMVRRDTLLSNAEKIESDVTGSMATNFLNKVLKKHYTEVEIEERLSMFQEEYDYDLIQQHTLPDNSIDDVVICYKNCYEYDINAAHTYALYTIFPKAKKDILDMYTKRHENNNFYKKVVNYYVGCLGHVPDEEEIAEKHLSVADVQIKKNHRLTYNWIVHMITRKLIEFENMIGGTIIYDNTDGLIVQNPDLVPDGSKDIGEFGLEYHGDVFVYTDKNYYVIQGQELKGNALRSIRNNFDLKNGTVVHYDRVMGEHHNYVASNVKVEKLDVIDID